MAFACACEEKTKKEWKIDGLENKPKHAALLAFARGYKKKAKETTGSSFFFLRGVRKKHVTEFDHVICNISSTDLEMIAALYLED